MRINRYLKILLLLTCLLVGDSAWAQSCSNGSIDSLDELFAGGVNSAAAMATCAAEGNCTPCNGGAGCYFGYKRGSNWQVHSDRLDSNGYANMGYCSLQRRSNPSGTPQGADQICYENAARRVNNIKSVFQSRNIDPEQNVGWVMTAVDMLNQFGEGNKGLLEQYADLLVIAQDKGLTGPDAALFARYNSCYEPNSGRWACSAFNETTGCTNQNKHVSQIASVLKSVCADYGGAGGSGGTVIDAPETANPCQFQPVSGDYSGSNTYQEPKYEPEKIEFLTCWSCNLIETIMLTAGTLGERIFDALKGGLKDIILIVATIIILFSIFKMLLPFGPLEQGRQMLNRIVAVIGVTSICMLLLSSMDFYWKYIYWPVLDGAMKASQLIISESDDANIDDYDKSKYEYNDLDPTSEEINKAMAAQMTDTVRDINEALSKGAAVGWAMLSSIYNYNFTNWVTGIANFFRVLLLVFSAAILMAVSFYASFVFLYVVIDVAIRWTFMSVLAPFAIAAFAFPQTRGFVSFLGRGLMESATALILVTAVAGLSMQMIEQVRIDPRSYDDQGQEKSSEYSQYKMTSSSDDDSFKEYIKKIQEGKALSPTMNTTAFWHMTTMFMIVGGLMFKMSGVASFLVGSAVGVGVAATAAAFTGGATAVATAPMKGGDQIKTALDNVAKGEMLRQQQEKDKGGGDDQKDDAQQKNDSGGGEAASAPAEAPEPASVGAGS